MLHRSTVLVFVYELLLSPYTQHLISIRCTGSVCEKFKFIRETSSPVIQRTVQLCKLRVTHTSSELFINKNSYKCEKYYTSIIFFLFIVTTRMLFWPFLQSFLTCVHTLFFPEICFASNIVSQFSRSSWGNNFFFFQMRSMILWSVEPNCSSLWFQWDLQYLSLSLQQLICNINFFFLFQHIFPIYNSGKNAWWTGGKYPFNDIRKAKHNNINKNMEIV